MCTSKPKIKAQDPAPPPPPPEKSAEELDMTEEQRRRLYNTRHGLNRLKINLRN
jgi:hypothetical protein